VNDDRGSVAGGAHQVERPAGDLCAFLHHRQAVVPLGLAGLHIEPFPVVLDLEFDIVGGLSKADFDLGRLRVLEGIHDGLARDLVDQQLDRRRQG
jgi:hypothetical protein